MNKKILPYMLSAIIGASAPLYADKMTIIGTDKTPATKTSEVKKSSETPSTNEKLIVGFWYSGKTNSQDAEKTLDSVCEKIEKETGKDIDNEKFKNWIKTSQGQNDLSVDLMVDKEKGLHIKNTVNYFNINAYELVKTSPAKVEKSSCTATTEKGSIGLAVESNYALFNAELGLGKNWYVNAGIGKRGYSPVEDIVTKTGTRFDAYGRTNTQDTETISSVGIDKRFNLKKGLYFAIGAASYNNAMTTKKTVEEMLLDKSGNVLASNNDSYENTNNNYSTKAKVALGFTRRHMGMELYAKSGGNENVTGLNFKYAFRGQK